MRIADGSDVLNGPTAIQPIGPNNPFGQSYLIRYDEYRWEVYRVNLVYRHISDYVAHSLQEYVDAKI